MTKQNIKEFLSHNSISILLLVGIIITVSLVGIVSATGTITLSVPSTALPSSTAAITHTVSGVTGKWGAIVNENLAGGCTFPDGSSNYKDAFLSSGGSSRQLAITTPPSGTCTLTGYYQFTDDNNPTTFQSSNILIGNVCNPDCSCASNTCTGQSCSNNCGGTCPGTKTCTTCTPSNSCASNTCIGQTCSDSCGGTVQGTKTCSGTCTDTCSSKGFTCGTQTICANSVNCGTCPTSQTCSNGACVTSTPASYCAFTEKFAFFQITGDKCNDGLIIVIAGAILIIVIIK